MDLNYLRSILDIFDSSTANDLEIEEEGTKIKLSKSSNQESPNSSNMPVFQFMTGGGMAPANFQQQAPTVTQSQQVSVPAETPKPEVAVASNLHEIKSPIVGTFYRSPSPDSDPFVEIGSKVKQGGTLCIVEAMKLMNEIESDISGTVVEILLTDTTPVEYNQVLFRIKPD